MAEPSDRPAAVADSTSPPALLLAVEAEGCFPDGVGCGGVVPADPLGVARKLGEQAAVTQHHGVAQQVGHDIDDAGLGDDVPDAPARLVPVDHVVVAPAGGRGLRQQVVDIGADLGDLGCAANWMRSKRPS